MNWEQKFQAIQGLVRFKGDVGLHMRSPGNWYVSASGVERKEGSMLAGGAGGAGMTPMDAVVEYWNWLTDPKYYLVLGAYSTRRAVRWNGFMWEDVQDNV